MFMQVIQGKVADRAGLEAAMTRWNDELAEGAVGYLGSTGGFTDDDMFVVLARFESEEAARRNSARPEQGAWWAETASCFDGDVTFMDCPNTSSWLAGGSDDAGFVQIMEGHGPNPERMMERYADRIKEGRPEIIGGTVGSYDADGWVEAIYFTSEAEAREHEQMPLPDDIAEEMAREMPTDVRFLDLHQPMLVSARR
jgi:hypothetical protein